jgi:hypothetical protein
MGVKEAHPERSQHCRSVQEKESELQIGNVGKAMPRPTPGNKVNTADNARSNAGEELEEYPFMQVEEFCRKPREPSRPPELEDQTRPKHLCPQEAEEHRENEGVIVKHRKPAEDHSRPKGTQGGEEERQHDDDETSMEKEPWGACQDREQMPHPIAPGLQVWLAIAPVAAQCNGHFHDLGARTQGVDEEL